jgi:hypothetical protein
MTGAGWLSPSESAGILISSINTRNHVMSLLQQAGATANSTDKPTDSTASTDVVEVKNENPGDQLAETLNANLFGAPAAMSPEVQQKMKTLFPDLREDGAEPDESPKEPIAAFRHKQVRLFQVGQFVFYDSILYIYTMEELELFAELYKTLGGQDKVNIVAYNWQAAAAVESDASSAIRGMLTSRSIKDPKSIKNS